MSELKVYKMIDEAYCDDSFCVVPSDVYLKSEVDEVIAEKDLKIKELEKRTKHALKNLRVAFADAMRQVWSKEVELCHHEYVDIRQALTLEHFWEKVKDTLKRKKFTINNSTAQ